MIMKHPHAYRIAIYLFIHLYIHAVPALSQQPASSHASATPDPAFQGEASLEAINLFMDGIRQDLLHERYEKLEALARTLRTSKARFPGGTWRLKVFYHATTRPVSKGKVSEAEWNLFFPRLRKWEAKFPHSITPQVALAGAYVEYAWSARGNGYAYRVTEEGYNLFRARLIQAKKVLLESESLPEKCPEWFWTMLSIAKGEGWEWAEYEELFEDAIALEPAYQYFYTAKAVYLLPRWGGPIGRGWQICG